MRPYVLACLAVLLLSTACPYVPPAPPPAPPVPVPPPIPPPVPPTPTPVPPPHDEYGRWEDYLALAVAIQQGTATQASVERVFGTPIPQPPAYVEVNPPNRYVVAYRLHDQFGGEIRLHVYYDRAGGKALKAEPG